VNFFNLFFKPKPKTLPANDFFQITSQEVVGDLKIVFGRCKKRIVEKNLPPLTKMFEKQHKCAVSLSIDPEDSYILKAVFMPSSPIAA